MAFLCVLHWAQASIDFLTVYLLRSVLTHLLLVAFLVYSAPVQVSFVLPTLAQTSIDLPAPAQVSIVLSLSAPVNIAPPPQCMRMNMTNNICTQMRKQI